MTLDLQTQPRTRLTVRRGRPLSGTVRVDGSKNAALPLLAAAAALRRPVRLANVPRSSDAQLMAILLRDSGFVVAQRPGGLVIEPKPGALHAPELSAAARIRASYYLVPTLLAQYGTAALPWPGGCSIGDRGMELHFVVYQAFGDNVRTDRAGYRVRASATPETVELRLPFRSRGASVCAVLRAVAGGQRLRLGNPNRSPEFTGMLSALRAAGCDITDQDDLVAVEPPAPGSQNGEAPDSVGGVVSQPVEWTVPGDKVEAGTIAAAIAATGGQGRIEGVDNTSLTAVVDALRCLGVPAVLDPAGLVITGPATRPLGGLEAVASLDPDGLDADFEPALMALALGTPGSHLFADDINPGRHANLIPQLARLGAIIEELSPTRCRLTGPQQLTGTAVEATDIRTGSALLIAALTAHGTTTISGLDQLRRGHPNLPGKLRWLGAEITGDER